MSALQEGNTSEDEDFKIQTDIGTFRKNEQSDPQLQTTSTNVVVIQQKKDDMVTFENKLPVKTVFTKKNDQIETEHHMISEIVSV